MSTAMGTCTCSGGVTDAQFKLANLSGALQVVEGLVVDAQHAVAGPFPFGNPPLNEDLMHLQYALTWAQGRLLNALPARTP